MVEHENWANMLLCVCVVRLIVGYLLISRGVKLPLIVVACSLPPSAVNTHWSSLWKNSLSAIEVVHGFGREMT